MPLLEKLTPDLMPTSAWSGGTTTQICIFPRTANYAEREFLWRISSATVDLQESDFTALPDYQRFISTLRGEIILTHNHGAQFTLKPYEIHAFSGGDSTHCVGRCTDFNLMLRRGKADGFMRADRLRGERKTLCLDSRTEETLIYCAEGSCKLQTGDSSVKLAAGEAAIAAFVDMLAVSAEDAALMICQMWRCDSLDPNGNE